MRGACSCIDPCEGSLCSWPASRSFEERYIVYRTLVGSVLGWYTYDCTSLLAGWLFSSLEICDLSIRTASSSSLSDFYVGSIWEYGTRVASMQLCRTPPLLTVHSLSDRLSHSPPSSVFLSIRTATIYNLYIYRITQFTVP